MKKYEVTQGEEVCECVFDDGTVKIQVFGFLSFTEIK